MATDMIANAATISSKAAKNSGLVTMMATFLCVDDQ